MCENEQSWTKYPKHTRYDFYKIPDTIFQKYLRAI